MPQSNLKADLAAMTAFEANPTPETLATVQVATAPVMADLVKTPEWMGDEENGVPGWAARNKAAILRIKSEMREAEAAARVAQAEARDEAYKQSVAAIRAAAAKDANQKPAGRPAHR